MGSSSRFRRRTAGGFAVALVALLALAAAGCDEDEPPILHDEPDPPVLATTPDQMVANLTRAYNERSFEAYEEILDDDFVFFFVPDEIDVLGQGASWNRARDVRSATNMFSAQPGQNPDGTPQAPVQRINLVMLEDDPDVPWTDQVAPEFTGTTMKRFRVEMDVIYTEGNPSEVLGRQEFYVAPVEIDADGATVTVYRLKYWRDLGKPVLKRSAGTDPVSWGALKARY